MEIIFFWSMVIIFSGAIGSLVYSTVLSFKVFEPRHRFWLQAVCVTSFVAMSIFAYQIFYYTSINSDTYQLFLAVSSIVFILMSVGLLSLANTIKGIEHHKKYREFYDTRKNYPTSEQLQKEITLLTTLNKEHTEALSNVINGIRDLEECANRCATHIDPLIQKTNRVEETGDESV